MKSTKKKAIFDEKSNTIYANGRTWTTEQLEKFKKYQTGFMKESYRTFIFRCSRVEDKPMVDYLEAKDNLAGYIKELVAKDMISKGLSPKLGTDEILAAKQKENEKAK